MVKHTGGRRTRKANMWAKAAGEYYRSHKNDPKIKEFRDVLKSPDFKNYYMSKYGKGKGMQSRSTKKNITRNNKKFPKYKRESMEEMDNEGESNEGESNEGESNENEDKDEKYEWVKVPKKGKKNGKKNKKSNKYREHKNSHEMKEEKEEDGWKWGGGVDAEEEVQPKTADIDPSQTADIDPSQTADVDPSQTPM